MLVRCSRSVSALRRGCMEGTKPEALSDGYRRTCTLQQFLCLAVCGAGIEALVVIEESRAR